MSKKSKTVRRKKKLKTFHVPVNVSISGHETVKAKNWQDAIKKARVQFFSHNHDNYCHGVDTPCIDIDFAECEDEVEIDDE